jgi:hypothetical protein
LDVDDDLVASLWWETGREDFFVGEVEDDEVTLGLWGISLSSTLPLEVEVLFLEALLLPLKNFIRAKALESWVRKKAVPTQAYAGYLEPQRSVQRPRQ